MASSASTATSFDDLRSAMRVASLLGDDEGASAASPSDALPPSPASVSDMHLAVTSTDIAEQQPQLPLQIFSAGAAAAGAIRACAQRCWKQTAR